jgi:hypothetical protein
MKIELTALETRVIGCLIEKQITTPDQYPLSLNALVSACNQKSNREPVLELDEAAVHETLDALAKKHLILERGGFGSRVSKYQHLFCNTEFGTLKFTPQELAIVCELLLRGPQTPGELRSHASRMAAFADVSEVETTLKALSERESGPLVLCLPREPGKREARYAHLFSGDPLPVPATGRAQAGSTRDAEESGEAGEAAAAPILSGSALETRLLKLESEVHSLSRELRELKAQLGC